jgi:hypothetical protein
MPYSFKFNFLKNLVKKDTEEPFEISTHHAKKHKPYRPVYHKKHKSKTYFSYRNKSSYSSKTYQDPKQLCIFIARVKYGKELN